MFHRILLLHSLVLVTHGFGVDVSNRDLQHNPNVLMARKLFASKVGGKLDEGTKAAPTRAKHASESDKASTIVTFSVSSGPADVVVSGVGKCLGKSECSLELPNGYHSVWVNSYDYRDSIFSITVPKGANRYVVSLHPKMGWLLLSAQDDSGKALMASIYVDGKEVGTTPKRVLVPLTACDVVLKAEGYDDATVRNHLWQDGGEERVTVTLKGAPIRATTGSVAKASWNCEMVRIPAGCFLMGSTYTYNFETPVHKVCLDAFSMDATEVTQGAYRSVMGTSPSRFSSCGDNCPVERVDWRDATSYCELIGKRLPTEAEWEYAARAGTTTEWYWGDDESLAEDYAWYDGNSGGKTHPVGLKKPNAWGLFDMSGNVYEWGSDWDDTYDSADQRNPVGPASGSFRVARGGCWASDPKYLRSSRRGNSPPRDLSDDLGFRCVGP